MSINYNLSKTFSLFLDNLKYNVMISIIISSIILFLICLFNKKMGKYLIIIINCVVLFLICKYYSKDIIKFEFENPFNNIYFYMFNSIVFITLISIKSILNKLTIYDYIFNSIFLIFISFALFMTHYLSNITYLIIFNIYPSIKFGNALMIAYYIVFLTNICYHAIIKSISKRSEML